MGQTTFGEPLNYKVSQNAAAIEADEEAMAILATGDTHVAIEAGKYVYVRDHSTLARGLYKNTSGSTIAANDPLSSSNLTATTEGGLNELNSNIGNIADYKSSESIVGKWGNNTLYRKPFEINANINESASVSIGTNLSVKMLEGYMMWEAGGVNYRYPFPYYSNGTSVMRCGASQNTSTGETSITLYNTNYSPLVYCYGYVYYTKG